MNKWKCINPRVGLTKGKIYLGMKVYKEEGKTFLYTMNDRGVYENFFLDRFVPHKPLGNVEDLL